MEPADLWMPVGVLSDFGDFLSWLAANRQEVRRLSREQYEGDNDPLEFLDVEEDEEKEYREQHEELLRMCDSAHINPESYATMFVHQPSKDTDLSYTFNVETYTGPPFYQVLGPLHFWALTVPLTARAADGWRPYYGPRQKSWHAGYGLPTPTYRAASGEFTVFVGNPWIQMRRNPKALGTMRAFVRVWVAISEFLDLKGPEFIGIEREDLVGLRISDSPKASSGVVGHLQLNRGGHQLWDEYWWSDPNEMDPVFEPFFTAYNGIAFYTQNIYEETPIG
jgi:hypothetical protein